MTPSDSPVPPGDACPTRFVIVAHARSGSTLLSSGLAQNGNVAMFGELFNDTSSAREDAYRQATSDPRKVNGQRYKRSQDGASYLEEVVYGHPNVGTSAIGFKLLYNQARGKRARPVWGYLAKDREIRVLHLERANLFATYVSLKTALQTGQWVNTHLETDGRPLRMVLDPTECARYFREVQRHQAQARELFDQHPVLRLTYEDDLCRDFAGTMRHAQEFLGLTPLPVLPSTYKQATQCLRSRVVNIESIAAYFVGTSYARYFATMDTPESCATPSSIQGAWCC